MMAMIVCHFVQLRNQGFGIATKLGLQCLPGLRLAIMATVRVNIDLAACGNQY